MGVTFCVFRFCKDLYLQVFNFAIYLQTRKLKTIKLKYQQGSKVSSERFDDLIPRTPVGNLVAALP